MFYDIPRAYLVFGIATVVIGICTYFLLADTPNHWLFRLTEVEYEIVEERTRDNNVVRVRDIKNSQVWESIKEPRFWILCLAICLNTLQNGGLVTYSTILVQNLGFSVSLNYSYNNNT